MFSSVKNLTKLAFISLGNKSDQDELMHRKSLEVILNLLASERGLAVKIAQILGSNSQNEKFLADVTQGKELAGISLAEIRPILEKAYGSNLSDTFSQIAEAKWIASLGQVHPCQLKDRQGDFVIKIQYPHIKEKIHDQLKLLGLFGHLGGKTKLKKWGFDISDYLQNFEKSLEEELNYLQESENLKKFSLLNQNRNIFYPQVVNELVRDNLLVTSYMPGQTIDDYNVSAAIYQKRKISEQLLMIYLEQLLADGFVQGDTHKGNFYIYQEKIVFLDFGHFLSLTENEKNALKLLFIGLMRGKLDNPLGILAELGFDLEKLHTIGDRIPLLLEVLFKPFIDNTPFQLDNWHPAHEIDLILGEHKWWFRSSGNARFFQLLRSFWGPYLIIKDFKVPINWYQCAQEVLARLSATSEIRTVEEYFEHKEVTSEHLRIEVFKDSNRTVDLYLPARSILNLENLIDEKLKMSIAAKGINLTQIKEQALKNNLAPMPLFELCEANKIYKIYLS